MRRYPICLWLTVLGSIIAVLSVFLTPCFVVRAQGERVVMVEARAGLPFSIHFIHSVQKTPVLENLEINDEKDGFNLLSTKYQSFGVGLPFLAEEGDFREEGDYYIFNHMDRYFRTLSLRTGVGTKLTMGGSTASMSDMRPARASISPLCHFTGLCSAAEYFSFPRIGKQRSRKDVFYD